MGDAAVQVMAGRTGRRPLAKAPGTLATAVSARIPFGVEGHVQVTVTFQRAGLWFGRR